MNMSFPEITIVTVLLAIFAFEIWMLVAMWQSAKTTEAKVLWTLGMLLVHPFVAIYYYFAEYNKNL